jgi:hypothetical protein
VPGKSDAIPVLISLPTVKAGAPAAAEISETPPGEEPQDASESTVSPPSAAPAVATDDETAVNPAPEPSVPAVAWPQFQSVRLAGQVLVALLMIGLFVAAYALILGGRDSGTTANNAEPSATAPADVGTPDLNIDPGQSAASAKPAPAETPAAPSAPQIAAEPTPSVEEPQVQASPAAPQGPIESAPTETPQMQIDTPQTLAGQARTGGPAGSSRNTITTPTAAQASARNDAPGPAAAPDTLNAQPPVEPRADRETAEPLGAPYPTTDPATFQYPADYQDRFQPRTNTAAAPNGSPWSANRGGNVWQPSTARLQAPSMR